MTLKEWYNEEPERVITILFLESGIAKRWQSSLLAAEVYLYVCKKTEVVYAFNVTGAFVSIREIAEDIKASKEQVKYAISNMKKHDIIKYVKHDKVISHYKAVNPEKFIERFED